MDKRELKILVSKPGGTASGNAVMYRINLPTAWIEAMKINKHEREVTAVFYDDKITIYKPRK